MYKEPEIFRPERFMPGGEYDSFDEADRLFMFVPFIQVRVINGCAAFLQGRWSGMCGGRRGEGGDNIDEADCLFMSLSPRSR